jgi:hypothetical protein
MVYPCLVFFLVIQQDTPFLLLSPYTTNKHSSLLDLAPIQLMTFEDVGLPADSNDRVVWRFAQTNEMLLLTANRNAKGEDSLEQVMREENQPTSFPIIRLVAK